ncbi:uncharacterized protein LAESUDRAFT_725735 [Laetiporus sulphureus 93-53]|uniref:Uncharacterized protein n=1 Tax=Laetiporus sulphureus 93-53 TaxID=1314785 RepID=A0A165EB87_9APHY|nr:uncharacterized protein LAESUDRAFT_725735 [Laetiporus sulphureus 93-53]KZT06644.1 hypothetical protein LAESUDRAFT_725735 [Laetiporus sulphureus 93-53]
MALSPDGQPAPSELSGPTLIGAPGDRPSPPGTPSPPSAISSMEAKHYYAGLHTASTGPVLICRTSRGVWELPRGAEEYFRPKELKVVGNHDIQDVWEKGLAAEVHVALREKKINWSSTDIVRICYADEHSGDVILWIGVRPDSSLSYEVAIDAALHCKSLVVARGILDVEVEMREADVFRRAGPQFLPPAFDLKSDPTAEVRMAPCLDTRHDHLFPPHALG